MTDLDLSPARGMLHALALQPAGPDAEDVFLGASQRMPHGRVFGGQVLAQSLVAAARTVPDGRPVHSMHGYFLRPGDSDLPITFRVERIHDGRSFCRRRTQAYQNDTPILSLIASFQTEDPGLDHQAGMPAGLPDPESLPGLDELLGTVRVPALVRAAVEDRAFELRHVSEPIYFSSDGERVAHQAVWMRAREAMPDEPMLHRAALAFGSDYSILEPIFRRHGVPWLTPGLKTASLDHAMWWHRFARVDQWLLYVQESPSASGGRGLSLGRIFTRDGMLVASVAQEGMVRLPRFAPDAG